MKELGALIGPGIRIELASDMPIFHCPYRYSDMERDLIRSQMLDLLEVGLLELSHGEYALATVMLAKKDVHGNYMDKRMCGNYCLINRQTKSDKYAMPTPEEIFDVVGHAKVFSTLDLWVGYHQLLIQEKDKAKTVFWGINSHGKDCLYQWKFVPFRLKNTPAEFQRVMDRISTGLDFIRCYIDDIVVYNDTMEEHQIHLQIVFERLKAHGLSLHPRNCKFF
jgi:putative transposase